MQTPHHFRKCLLPLLMATALSHASAWANKTVSPDYAAFVEAAAYVCTGTLFDDVPSSHWACGYIEEFANLGITSGCDANNYCPDANVTRAQMAVFFVKGLEETLYDQLDGSGSGLDADLLDGQDSGYYLNWDNFVGIPADLLDGDNDTLASLSCASGQVAKWNGSAWACAVDDTGAGGDITAVAAGTGLSGGGTTGDVTLSADTAYLQRRVSSSCAAGSSIRSISSTGTVTCEQDDDSGGDITTVNAGRGLEGGGVSGSVSLDVEIPLVLNGDTGGLPIRGIVETVNNGSYGYGLIAKGVYGGGSFEAIGTSTWADVGVGVSGVVAHGEQHGGSFSNAEGKGTATIADGDYGIWVQGATTSGHFFNADNSSFANIATGVYGLQASGKTVGGHLLSQDYSGSVWLADDDHGIRAFGDLMGGYFKDTTSNNFAEVGYSTYKIYGTGSVSFVQNHPEYQDEVIVYASPEGDEVATYTRGSARLVNGEARIALGETFKWVTNPDIGLTAHLTPVHGWAPLYVASKTTRELVVKSPPGYPDNVEFDYIVYGLRIGFEDTTVVQKKTQEARIPSMADHRKAIEAHPELARYTALSRYARMQGSTREAMKTQMVEAAALLEKIGEFDPKVHQIEVLERER